MTKLILNKKTREVIGDTFLADLSAENFDKKISEAYLGILVNDKTIFNPFDNIPNVANDKFAEYATYLMSQPDYFYFIIKYIFQMDSFPQQCLILKELYTHKFPLLIGSRGLGKSIGLALYMMIRMILIPGTKCVITSAGFRQSKVVFDYMETIWKKSLVLQSCFKGGKNGPTHGTDVWTFRLGDSITYALPVGPDGSKVRGYRANCVDKDTLIQTDIGLVKISEYLNHDCYKVLNMNLSLEMPDKIYKTVPTEVYKVTTANGYSLKCSKLHRLLVTDGKKTSWKLAKDLLPTDYLELDNNSYFPDKYVEYSGLRVDENIGYLIGLLISEGTVTNRNFITVSHTNKKLIDEVIAKFPDFNWCVTAREARTDSRGWKCKKSYNLTYSCVEFREKLKFLGIDNIGALKKEIPWCILQSPRSVVIEFLKGLMIGDGSCFKYSSKGKSHVGVTYYSSSETLINQIQILLLKFNITCCKNKRYTTISDNPNYMLAMRGEQAFKIYDLVKNQYWYDHIIKDGFKFERSIRLRKKGNSYLTETTRCDKTIYIGSYPTADEAEKAFIKYYDTVRPTVRVKTVELLPDKEALYDFVMPETESFLGGGFVNHNCLITDEFSSINRQVFEEVMSGFLSVAASPVEQIKHNAKYNTLRRIAVPVSAKESDSGFLQNQLILSGTAYYKMNHFYSYFNKWKEIINSKNNPKLLKDMFSNDEDAKHVNPNDYSIVRIPVELTANGYMDMAQISRIKASTTKDVYLREYGACLHPSTKILTKNGSKKIKDIRVGDMVLTHTGLFKKVNKLTYKKTDHLLAMSFYGNNKKMYVTDNHPLYIGSDEFSQAKDAKGITFTPISKKSLSNRKTVDLRNYVLDSEYSQYGDFIRSKHGSTALSNDQLRTVYSLFKSGKTKMEISKELNIKYNIVFNALKFDSFNKINPIVKLDYNLGIVLGYYSAEGSIGANGRATSFALDGHVDKDLLKFITQLKKSIKKSFNIDAVVYNKKKNTASITINNKIITSFIEKVCPGTCYDKAIDPDLLFSNEGFMKGFVVGFWNGDGHKRENVSKTQICSENLISQIRLVLNYFKVPNSQYIKKGGTSTFNGKDYIPSNRFHIEIFRQNNKLFLNKFYNRKFSYEVGQSKYYLKNDEIYHRLQSKSRIPFNGYVYNLEVDDDNSYHTEFGCVHNCFSDDSDGFFKKSLIDSCTCVEIDKDRFPPALYGSKTKKYVYGVDPAYEGDNFAVVIIELNGSHRRVVHVWTTQASDHKQRLRDGVITENDYYHYCVRKIRDLMKRFPCEYIAIDSQGGGRAVMEAFTDVTKLKEGESVILPSIEATEKVKDTDILPGLHIIKVINFTSEWIAQANYALKKDMEDKTVRFPLNDAISYALAEYYDESMGDSKELYDTLDDCIFEIEELKKELTTIIVSETSTGREKFDTPSTKIGINRKGRLKKDRYSALLMCNFIARDILTNEDRFENPDLINLSNFCTQVNTGVLFRGNSKIAAQLNKLYSDF